MARANQYLLPGQVWHLTHRCHDRSFLLRFGRDRDAYLFWLREGLRRYAVTLLGYCVTCNHVHLVVYGAAEGAVSELMQLVEGRVARQYNDRKGRDGAFWSDRFHGTMIDSGEYLWNCLTYVDLNMARAQAVPEPGQWRWCSYAELVGAGEVKPLVDRERLAELFGCRSVEALRERWREQIRYCLERRHLQRQAYWTESVAVGRREYVDWVISQLHGRQQWKVEERVSETGMQRSVWSVHETGALYAAPQK